MKLTNRITAPGPKRILACDGGGILGLIVGRALPEFFDKVHNQGQRALDSWVEEVKETNYTVVRGDHLWGIAKKAEHYGNGFAWPMIYKANRDKIKNPDLIYPQQVFSIPKLTEEEKAKYDKVRKYYKPAPVQ